MASSTLARVAAATQSAPFETRDTVWDDTPARRATSSMEGPVLRRPRPAVLVLGMGRS